MLVSCLPIQGVVYHAQHAWPNKGGFLSKQLFNITTLHGPSSENSIPSPGQLLIDLNGSCIIIFAQDAKDDGNQRNQAASLAQDLRTRLVIELQQGRQSPDGLIALRPQGSSLGTEYDHFL